MKLIQPNNRTPEFGLRNRLTSSVPTHSTATVLNASVTVTVYLPDKTCVFTTPTVLHTRESLLRFLAEKLGRSVFDFFINGASDIATDGHYVVQLRDTGKATETQISILVEGNSDLIAQYNKMMELDPADIPATLPNFKTVLQRMLIHPSKKQTMIEFIDAVIDRVEELTSENALLRQEMKELKRNESQ